MTDARLPSRWLTDPALEELSDRLWRIHTGALMWSAEQGTDGRIPTRTMRLLHPDGATAEDGLALVTAGLWRDAGDAYEVIGWDRTQSLAADVEAQRDRNRRNSKAYRDRLKNGPAVTADVIADVPAESSRRGEARLPGVSSSSRNGWEGATPPPSTCQRHPHGTDQPCMACKRARVAAEERQAAEASRPKPVRPHEHAWAEGGTCYRPLADGQPCLARRAEVSA